MRKVTNPKALLRRVPKYREIGSIKSGDGPMYYNPLAKRARNAEENWTYTLSPDDIKKLKRRRWGKKQTERALVQLGRGSLPAVNRASRIARHMVGSARERARSLHVPFSLTLRWAYDKIMTGQCELTGLPFDFDRELSPGEGLRSNLSPSLDRRVPSLGYTPENCRIVIWAYNGAKGSGTDREVLLMAEALVRRQAQLIDG